MLYKSFEEKVKATLAEKQLDMTMSNFSGVSDESIKVELIDSQNKSHTMEFTPDADGNYKSDGEVTPKAIVAKSEEEAKQMPETKSEEEEAKTESKADEYMAKVAKAMEKMTETCSKMCDYMSSNSKAEAETKDETDSKESKESGEEAKAKATEAKAKTTIKNWWENVKPNY